MAEGGDARKGRPTPHDWRNAPRRRDLSAARKHLPAVLDEWFEQVARPRLKGRCQLIRYADDAVIAFEDHLSGKRLLEVLSKRLGRYELQLHPTKTRFVDFRSKRPGGPSSNGGDHIQLPWLHPCVGAVEEG